MRTRNRKLSPWLAALLCLTLTPGVRAADNADTPKAPNAQETGAQPKLAEQDVWLRWKLAHDARETSTETQPNAGAPAKFNKASGILGMDVRNQKDEHLGHIKDLVVDWKTEQVSYAVISTGARRLPAIDEKLLAVPLTALTLSSDQKHLILNADKSKIAAAAGFGRNNWPSVSNPSWGAEPVWQKETSTPVVTEEPARKTNATAEPDRKPNQDPESKPDMENESKPDMNPDEK